MMGWLRKIVDFFGTDAPETISARAFLGVKDKGYADQSSDYPEVDSSSGNPDMFGMHHYDMLIS